MDDFKLVATDFRQNPEVIRSFINNEELFFHPVDFDVYVKFSIRASIEDAGGVAQMNPGVTPELEIKPLQIARNLSVAGMKR
ncbi:hypothetical protein D3C85_1759340 [compost metagenome]